MFVSTGLLALDYLKDNHYCSTGSLILARECGGCFWSRGDKPCSTKVPPYKGQLKFFTAGMTVVGFPDSVHSELVVPRILGTSPPPPPPPPPPSSIIRFTVS